MKRRSALKKTTWILKSTLLAPSLLSAIQACRPQVEQDLGLLVLDMAQNELIKALADTIIPRTDTPSATDVKVHQFMDLLLQDVFEDEMRDKFLTGLSEYDQDCLSATGSSFIDLNADKQINYLEQVDQEIMGRTYDFEVPFFYSFKHLTTIIYFSTEQGVKQNLNYQPVPGTYQGNVAYQKGDRIMAGNRISNGQN